MFFFQYWQAIYNNGLDLVLSTQYHSDRSVDSFISKLLAFSCLPENYVQTTISTFLEDQQCIFAVRQSCTGLSAKLPTYFAGQKFSHKNGACFRKGPRFHTYYCERSNNAWLQYAKRASSKIWSSVGFLKIEGKVARNSIARKRRRRLRKQRLSNRKIDALECTYNLRNRTSVNFWNTMCTLRISIK